MASEIHDLLVKTYAADTAKIAEIKHIVAEHFDVDTEEITEYEETGPAVFGLRAPG